MENKRNYRLNNQQRHAILRDYKAKHKVRDIAARYSICPSYVSTLARRYGCTMRRSDMSKRNRELVRARDDGMPWSKIAAEFGISESRACTIYKRDSSNQSRYEAKLRNSA